uniref:Uncharacterized protein n=1 Tax=Anopheles merus TaxID=30066 RepID=A0A182US65_ANOME
MPVDDVTNETDPGVDVRLSAMGDPLLLSVSGGEGEAAFDTGPADFSCSAAAAALCTAAAAITFFSGCGAFGIEVAEISWCWLLQQQPLPKACRYSTSTRTTTTTTATFSSSSFSTPGSCLNARFKRWLVCIRFVSCSQRCMATFRCFTASTTTSTLASASDVVFLFDRLGARSIICFFLIDNRSCGRTGSGSGGGVLLFLVLLRLAIWLITTLTTSTAEHQMSSTFATLIVTQIVQPIAVKHRRAVLMRMADRAFTLSYIDIFGPSSGMSKIECFFGSSESSVSELFALRLLFDRHFFFSRPSSAEDSALLTGWDDLRSSRAIPLLPQFSLLTANL